jgi:hypothetical protein
LCFGELGWTRERYLHATVEEFTEAIKGYWKKWERQTAWITRELIWTLIQGNPNIPNENKPKHKEEIYKLTDDKKEVVKVKRPKITSEDLKMFEMLKHQ